MNRILTILFLFLFFNSPKQALSQDINAHSKTVSPSVKNQTITYKLTEANNHTYGYNIFINDSLFIRQPFIPCIAGNKGFKTKADAKKVAVLVVEKISNGIVPPSVTIPEMQKLGIDLK